MPVLVNSSTPVKDKDEWRTPPELFALLDYEFNFEVDAAATRENSLCPNFWSKKASALTTAPWYGYRVFCNPPFSQTGDFLRKGVEETAKGAICVFLVRADGIETKWWTKNLLRPANLGIGKFYGMSGPQYQIRFLTPRVNYLEPVGNRRKGVTFPSAVIVMGRYDPEVFWWNWKEAVKKLYVPSQNDSKTTVK